jgi:hypothetical protein
MKTGDPVVVENIDGETAQGEITAILATTVSEFEAEFLDVQGATVYDYWRGHGVDPDAPVVQVTLGDGVYSYPADRVEVLDG